MPDDLSLPTRLLAAIEENNSYWRKYGPMLEEMWGLRSKLSSQVGKKGAIDYLGEAVVTGRFDALIKSLSDAADVRLNPARRRRR